MDLPGSHKYLPEKEVDISETNKWEILKEDKQFEFGVAARKRRQDPSIELELSRDIPGGEIDVVTATEAIETKNGLAKNYARGGDAKDQLARLLNFAEQIGRTPILHVSAPRETFLQRDWERLAKAGFGPGKSGRIVFDIELPALRAGSSVSPETLTLSPTEQ